MKSTLFLLSLVYSIFGLNLEFNSKQFPNWIKTPFIYSSFVAPIYDIEGREDQSSCVYFVPKNDKHSNESFPYIFESKCYKNSHCANDEDRQYDSSRVMKSDSCRKLNGTIDKVGIFSIAEYNNYANQICYYVYMIIEGCYLSGGFESNLYLSWILTNDTKYKPTILKNYQLNLPLNDNKFYFGEMTFDDGDRNCSNLCSQVTCEKSLDLKIGRNAANGNGTVSQTTKENLDSVINEKPIKGDVQTTFLMLDSGKNDGSSNGMMVYVPIIIGFILIVAIVGYLVYHTMY